MDWDPTLYETFAGPRLRPGLDLIAQIRHEAPQRIVDLGCGTGKLAQLLKARWPEADVTGLDASVEMLDEARALDPSITWVEGDIATWGPGHDVDIVFSNAALHWLPDHAALFPRLMDWLTPGGVLAVQMPNNFGAPSHTLIRDVVEAHGWSNRIDLPHAPVAAPAAYYDWLAPRAESVSIWQTTYLQTLGGDDAVLTWVRSTALQPVFAALDEAETEQFLADYGSRLRNAYPRRADGTTLFPFTRIFIVAKVGR